MKIHLAVVADGTNLVLIKHFIEWYRDRVDLMHFTINAPDPEPAVALLRSEGIEPAFVWADEYQTRGLRAYRDRMRKECVPNDEWCVTVDCDEFQTWNPKTVLTRYGEGYNLVPGIMVDMVAEDGTLKKMLPDVPLLKQYPRKCYATQKIGKSWIAKIAAMRGHDLEAFGEGGGYTYISPDCETRVLPLIVETLHFKWDDTTKERMVERAERYHRLGIEWHGLSRNLSDYLERYGCIRFEDCEEGDFDTVDPRMLQKQYGSMYNGESLSVVWQGHRQLS